jgi:hypothetical protein
MPALTTTEWRVEEANTAYAHAACSALRQGVISNIRLHRNLDHGSEASTNRGDRLQTPWLSAFFLLHCGDRVGDAWRLGAGDPLISTRWLLGITFSALLVPCLAFSWIYRARFHIEAFGYHLCGGALYRGAMTMSRP